MDFRLRIAKADDVEGIADLIAASVRGLQAADYSPAQIEGALATVFTVDSRLIADGTYFVAYAEGGVLAGCGGWSHRSKLCGGDHHLDSMDSGGMEAGEDTAKIRAIFVHPRFVRMGLGSLLLAAAEEAAKAHGFRRFEMGSTLTGVALYTLKGYRERLRFRVAVGGGETIEVVRMVKEIHPPE